MLNQDQLARLYRQAPRTDDDRAWNALIDAVREARLTAVVGGLVSSTLTNGTTITLQYPGAARLLPFTFPSAVPPVVSDIRTALQTAYAAVGVSSSFPATCSPPLVGDVLYSTRVNYRIVAAQRGETAADPVDFLGNVIPENDIWAIRITVDSKRYLAMQVGFHGLF